MAAVEALYTAGETDEFLKPQVFGDPADECVRNGDGIFFINFRADRGRELVSAFHFPAFDGFDRGGVPALAGLVTMTSYDSSLHVPVHYVCTTEYDASMPNVTVAYPRQKLTNIFGEYISRLGLTQLRIAETEKYAHVTYFFSGGREEPFPLENRILVNSPKDVATYDLKPEMSAPQVCGKLLDAIRSEKYDVIVINFANPDMVGHTGVISAAIKAIETVDECVGKAVQAVKDVDGVLFICADHGNAEQMIDYTTGQPHTAHTTNPVPFILVNYDPAYTLKEGGCLADIVPTLINVMGMEQPAEMTGKSLLIKK